MRFKNTRAQRGGRVAGDNLTVERYSQQERTMEEGATGMDMVLLSLHVYFKLLSRIRQ